MSLRAIQKRIQSYNNMKKITSTMKVVSAAKLVKTEHLAKVVRPFGIGTLSFYERYTHIDMLDHIKDHLMFAVTSDRGLCSSMHLGIVKKVREELSRSSQQFAKVVCIGKKSEDMLIKTNKSNILLTVFQFGKENPTFIDASRIFNECASVEYIACQIFYNIGITKTISKVNWISLYNTELLLTVIHIASLDEIEEDHLRCYVEFSTVSLLFFAMVENSLCEHSIRMLAMDGASKNIARLTNKSSLEYNRLRQSKITSELIEIISGSQVVTEK